MKNQQHQNMLKLQTHFWREAQKYSTTWSMLFTNIFILGSFHNVPYTTLACGFWIWKPHTHKHNLHPLAKAHFSFTCCNKQLHISTRKPENSAGIAQSLLSLTRIPLCNISPLFLATHYNIPSKKSFLADFVRPSADKPNSSLLKVPCNTSRLGSLIPDHLTYQIFFFFSPKKTFFA